jgi:hypothetical protein
MKRLLLLLAFLAHLQSHAQGIAYPLKASADHRFITDQLGRPVFLKGCAAWRLGYNVSMKDVGRFLQDRKLRGFNALIIEITPDGGTGNRGDMPDVNGEHCFIGRDLAKPNEKFFLHVDSVLNSCRQMNMTVMLSPLYLGCCTDGWLEMLRETPNDTAKCRAYGAWVARRYRHLPNIIWVSGGDHNETPESIAFAEGLASEDTSHLHTYHPNPAYTSTERLPNATWLNLSCIYTYFPDQNVQEYHVYGQIHQETLRNKRMPYVMFESAYEYERGETTQTIRRQAWWALLSGVSGHFFGNRDVWMMNDNWLNMLNTPATKSMQVFHDAVNRIPWQDLEPDWQHTVFVSGRGHFNEGTSPGGEDYATAAISHDGRLGILYLPEARSVGVNLSRFAGPVTVSWMDPFNGKKIITTNKVMNQGYGRWSPPTVLNSQGFEDWVLFIESKK